MYGDYTIKDMASAMEAGWSVRQSLDQTRWFIEQVGPFGAKYLMATKPITAYEAIVAMCEAHKKNKEQK